MVVTWLIRMRPVDAPEAAYRSAAHWYVLVSVLMLILVEGFFVYAGIVMVRTPGESAGGLMLSVALAAGAMTVALLSSLVRPRLRRDRPPAVWDGTGLRLPVRRLPILVQRLGLVAFSGSGIFLIARPTGPLDRAAGIAVLVLLGGSLAVSLLVSPQIRLDPEGLTLPHWDPTCRYLAWDEIDHVEALGNFHPHLAVTLRGETKPVTCTLHYHAWPPSAVLAAVQHFAERAPGRRLLADPASLERFRTWT